MSVYDELKNQFGGGGNAWDLVKDQFAGADVSKSQGAGTATQGPSLSSYTDANGVTHPNTGAPPSGGAASGAAGGNGTAGVEGQGFDEDYWKGKLSGGTGVSQALGGGGNYFGSGPGANADLEAILMQNGMPALDAQTIAAFAKAKESQTLAAEGVFTTDKDAMMEDMFGRGMNRSTVAGEAGGRMLEGQARTMAGIEAQDAMARMGQQNILADRVQKGAMAAGDTRSRFRQAQATENAAGSNANATRAIASANMKAAEISAQSRMATTMAELDLKRELGLGALDIQGDQLDFSYWAKEGDWANNIDQIGEQKPDWWQSAIGALGGGLSSYYSGGYAKNN